MGNLTLPGHSAKWALMAFISHSVTSDLIHLFVIFNSIWQDSAPTPRYRLRGELSPQTS